MLEITHPPQGVLSKIGDYIMTPIMYLLQGTFREKPQRTHYWNNKKYTAKHISFLSAQMLVTIEPDPVALPRWFGIVPIFHIPILGGWKKYIVLEPIAPQDEWYVGWVAGDTIGISQVRLTGSVRVLRGQSIVQFFGINEHGQQISVQKIGQGEIGKAGIHSHVPLL